MNPNIANLEVTILSRNWYVLRKATYDFRKPDGSWEHQQREVYDRGNGAAILLYNAGKGTVILTRQFRMPTYLNGNADGMLIEACAGLLDTLDPETAIRKEAEEETGYQVGEVKKVFEAYMSPGSVTEILHFFIAPYTADMKMTDGGGLAHEQENIEVLEIPFSQSLDMIKTGDIRDGKTIMLLQYAQLNLFRPGLPGVSL
jgi:nudix-type nucleoside diphosphatase (YffH/AdpP family)